MLRVPNRLMWAGVIGAVLLLGLVMFPSETYFEKPVYTSPKLAKDIRATGSASEGETVPREVERLERNGFLTARTERNLIVGSVKEHLSGDSLSAVVNLFYSHPYEGKTLVQSAISSVDGEYRFVIEYPGEYEVQIAPDSLPVGFRPSSALSSTDMLRLGRKDLERSMVTIGEAQRDSLSRVDLYAFLNGKLEGLLLDHLGKPIQGALVSAYSRIGPTKGGYTFDAVTNQSGRFSIENCSPGWVTVSFSLNSARSALHRSLVPPILPQFRFSEGQVINIGNVFARTGNLEITGTMLDQFGIPFVGVSVLCKLKSQGYADFIQKSTTNDHGDFLLSGLSPGEYSVLTTRDGFSRSQNIAELQFSIEDYAIPVVLTLESLNIGTVVSQRPVLFSTQLVLTDDEARSSLSEKYSIKIQTETDEEIQRLIRDASAAGNYVRHAYDWDTSPPWFNKEPEVEWNLEAQIFCEIRCLLPHAPIVVTFYKKGEEKESSIRIYPSLSSDQKIFITLPQ